MPTQGALLDPVMPSLSRRLSSLLLWKPPLLREWPRFALSQVLVLSGLAVGGYRDAFTSFPDYDDQGYFMILSRLFLQRQPLYDTVKNIYGPFYYFTEWLVHGLFRIPLTHDLVQFQTLFYWIISIELLGICLFVVNRNVAVTVVGQIVLFVMTHVLVFEPGHPQELILVLLCLMLVASLVWGKQRLVTASAVIGVAAGAIFACKLNLGVFAIIASALSLVLSLPRSRTNLALGLGMAALTLSLPVTLMWRRFDDLLWIRYSTLVFLCMIPLLLVSFQISSGDRTWKMVAAFGAACSLSILFSLAFVMLRGSTMGAIVNLLVVRSVKYAHTFGWPPMVPRYLVFIFPVSLLLAIAALACRSLTDSLHRRRASWALFAIKLAYGMMGIQLACAFRRGNDEFKPAGILSMFLWLILVPPMDGRRVNEHHFSRLLMAWLAMMEVMWAFPVAGSQVALSTFLPLAVSLVCLGDSLTMIPALVRSERSGRHLVLSVLTLIFCIILPFSYSYWDQVTQRYTSGVTPKLPGISRLRLPEARSAEYQLVTANLASYSDMFLCTDGFNSLYFWTGKTPPARILLSHSLDLLDDKEQDELIGELLKFPRACVVVQKPLRSSEGYDRFKEKLAARFKLWFRTDHLVLLVPKNRPCPPAPFPLDPQ